MYHLDIEKITSLAGGNHVQGHRLREILRDTTDLKHAEITQITKSLRRVKRGVYR